MSGIIAQNSGRHTGLVKASSSAGVWNLILTQTASSSATIDFTSGIDSTYDEYVFKCINIHGSADGEPLTFQVDTGTNTNYNTTVTNTFFRGRHNEADSIASLAYVTTYDQAQGTSFIRCNGGGGTGNDENASMTLHMFDPANSTFVKHYMFKGVNYQDNDGAENLFGAGYFNITTALTRVQFKMGSGTIDAGTISLYGIT